MRFSAPAAIQRPAGGGQVLPGVIVPAIPLAPPRGAVAVLFPGVDGMAQPVINIRFPGLSQNDALSPQCGQRRQREPFQHDTQNYVGVGQIRAASRQIVTGVSPAEAAGRAIRWQAAWPRSMRPSGSSMRANARGRDAIGRSPPHAWPVRLARWGPGGPGKLAGSLTCGNTALVRRACGCLPVSACWGPRRKRWSVKDTPTPGSKSSVRVTGREPEARGADAGPIIRRKPVNTPSSSRLARIRPHAIGH